MKVLCPSAVYLHRLGLHIMTMWLRCTIISLYGNPGGSTQRVCDPNQGNDLTKWSTVSIVVTWSHSRMQIQA